MQRKPRKPVYPAVPAKMRQFRPVCWLPFRDAWVGLRNDPQTVYDVAANRERSLLGTNPKPVPWLQTRGNDAFGAEDVAHHMYFPAPDLVPWVAPWTLLVTGWRGSPSYASHSTVYTTTLGQTYVLRTSLSFNRIFGAYIQNAEYATARNWVVGESYNLAYRFQENQRFCIVVNGEVWLDTIATRGWTPSDVNLIGWSTNNASSNMRGTSLEEFILLYGEMTDGELIAWSLDPYGYWEAPQIVVPWYAPSSGALPSPDTDVYLAYGLPIDIDPAVPTLDAPADVTPPATAVDIDPAVPTTDVVGDFEVYPPATTVDIDPAIPDVELEELFDVNLPATELVTDPAVPTVEGESDLPPVITTPTQDQVYVYGASGTLAAPPHDIGTGSSPVWSLFVDNFGIQPGVTTWVINPATGDITYAIGPLTTDPDSQALNTKGPYSVTRRLTTTVAHVDETFDCAVNIGDRTLQMTPGTPCYTYTTTSVTARGVEPAMDPSPQVSQPYVVT